MFWSYEQNFYKNAKIGQKIYNLFFFPKENQPEYVIYIFPSDKRKKAPAEILQPQNSSEKERSRKEMFWPYEQNFYKNAKIGRKFITCFFPKRTSQNI